jgi:hypothetical protein
MIGIFMSKKWSHDFWVGDFSIRGSWSSDFIYGVNAFCTRGGFAAKVLLIYMNLVKSSFGITFYVSSEKPESISTLE